MSELQVIPEPEPAKTVSAPAANVELSKLGKWARDARDAHTVATSLARTVFVPKEMQGNTDLVTAAILTGCEMGLQPMAALRSIDVIQGVPAMRAHALRGLVQAAGHEVWVEESTQTRAVVCGRRVGSDTTQKSVWTIDRATMLGIAGRDQWRKQPQSMLIARGTAEVCRLIASDVLLGMPYAIEELDEPEEVKPARKAKRKADPIPVAEPRLDIPEPQDDSSATNHDSAPEPEFEVVE